MGAPKGLLYAKKRLFAFLIVSEIAFDHDRKCCFLENKGPPRLLKKVVSLWRNTLLFCRKEEVTTELSPMPLVCPRGLFLNIPYNEGCFHSALTFFTHFCKNHCILMNTAYFPSSLRKTGTNRSGELNSEMASKILKQCTI